MKKRTRKIVLNLDEDMYIDLVESIDSSLARVIHLGGKHLSIQHDSNEGLKIQKRILNACVKEYDSYMTLRALITKN